jgi:hypothetical protein
LLQRQQQHRHRERCQHHEQRPFLQAPVLHSRLISPESRWDRRISDRAARRRCRG